MVMERNQRTVGDRLLPSLSEPLTSSIMPKDPTEKKERKEKKEKREKKKKEVAQEAPADAPTTDVPEDVEMENPEETKVEFSLHQT